MLHRIRLAMQSQSFTKLGGCGSEVEVDESYIGGKVRNMRAFAPVDVNEFQLMQKVIRELLKISVGAVGEVEVFHSAP